MQASCPKCRRATDVDQEVGDFPTRCDHCGTLVRRRSQKAAPEAEPTSTRIQRGTLAGLLISRTAATPAIIHAHGTLIQAPSHSVLRPESRREILRAKARQKAIARAELKCNDQALTTLTWTGLALVLLLGLGVVALKARAMWQHPAPARADILRVGGS